MGKTRTLTALLVLAAAAALSACGGGGSSAPPPPPSALTVVYTSPAASEDNVYVGLPSLLVRFDDDLDPSSVKVDSIVVTQKGSAVKVSGKAAIPSGRKNEISFVFDNTSAPLAYGKTYVAAVSSSVKSVAGDSLGSNYSFEFSSEASWQSAKRYTSQISNLVIASYGTSVSDLSDGGAYIAGQSSTGSGFNNAFVARLNSSGGVVWSKTKNFTSPLFVKSTDSLGAVFASSPGNSVTVSVYDNAGTTTTEGTVALSQNEYAVGGSVAMSADGSLYISVSTGVDTSSLVRIPPPYNTRGQAVALDFANVPRIYIEGNTLYAVGQAKDLSGPLNAFKIGKFDISAGQPVLQFYSSPIADPAGAPVGFYPLSPQITTFGSLVYVASPFSSGTPYVFAFDSGLSQVGPSVKLVPPPLTLQLNYWPASIAATKDGHLLIGVVGLDNPVVNIATVDYLAVLDTVTLGQKAYELGYESHIVFGMQVTAAKAGGFVITSQDNSGVDPYAATLYKLLPDLSPMP